MESSIAAGKITFTYGQGNILDELSLEIGRGSFVSIIGPNGSGKSTLLKNITAEFTPQKGFILLENKNIFRIKKKILAGKMAVVPQDTDGGFDFSVLETVLMGRMPHQKRFQSSSEKDLQIARRAMELTNVWAFRDRSINQLSGGEKQRVILARALAQEPKVLILDEPTSHLDIQHQLELLELLQDLNKTEGLTIIAVLHDLNLAAQFSQKLVLLHNGRIMAYGSPRQVLTVKNIRETYQIEIELTTNELTGRINIIPLGKPKARNPAARNLKIHLICGGGSGAYLLEQLYQSGFSISCGVLNIGDSDWKKARELQIAVAEESPFSTISDKALKINQELIRAADWLIVLPVPFGKGNLANLRQVSDALLSNSKKVLILEQGDFRQRDFTGGEATEIMNHMMQNGAVRTNNMRNILDWIGGN